MVGCSVGSSIGRTRRVPRIVTSCSARVRSGSELPPNGPVEGRLGLMVRDPEASVLTVTSEYMELTLASFMMKSESSSWS